MRQCAEMRCSPRQARQMLPPSESPLAMHASSLAGLLAYLKNERKRQMLQTPGQKQTFERHLQLEAKLTEHVTVRAEDGRRRGESSLGRLGHSEWRKHGTLCGSATERGEAALRQGKEKCKELIRTTWARAAARAPTVFYSHTHTHTRTHNTPGHKHTSAQQIYDASASSFVKIKEMSL
jgi:hypothetical protein